MSDEQGFRRNKPVYVGNALLGYYPGRRRKTKRPFRRKVLQLRELEGLIRHRHGAIIPQTDDAIIYAEIAAIMHLVIDRDGIENSFPAWCRRWMPWADSKLVERILYEDLRQHHQMPSDDALGQLLRLTYAERTELDIRCIGSHDVTRRERAKLKAQRKREQDRARKRRKRRDSGIRSRTDYERFSASRQKPWREAGISRSTWYRRKRCS